MPNSTDDSNDENSAEIVYDQNQHILERVSDTMAQLQQAKAEQQRNNRQTVERKQQFIEYPYIPNYQYRNVDRVVFKNQLNVDEEENENALKIQNDIDKRLLYIKDYEYSTVKPQKPVNKKNNEEKKPQHEAYEYVLIIFIAPIGLIVYIVKEMEINKYNEQKIEQLQETLKKANVVKKITIPKKNIQNPYNIQSLGNGVMTARINNPNDKNEINRAINNALNQRRRRQINNENQNLTNQTSNNINNNQI